MKLFFSITKILSFRGYILIILSLVAICLILLLSIGYIQSMYSFYKDILHIPIAQNKPIIIVSSYALAPFTSLISVDSIEEALENIPGVEKIVYQVIVLGYTKGKTFIVRGINPKDFVDATNYRVIEGIDLSDNCFYCIWLGTELAKDLDLKPGDIISIYSLFISMPINLEVAGIIDVERPYSYEAITSLSIAQALRGIDRRHVSIAIISLESHESYERVMRKLGIDIEKDLFIERIVIALRYIGRKIEPIAYNDLSEVFMSRLNISRDIYLAIMLSITFILSIGSYIIGQTIVFLNIDTLSILYEQGLSIKKIKLLLAIALAICIVISFIIALIFFNILSRYIELTMISYRLQLYIDREAIIAIVSYISLFSYIGLTMAKIYEE